MNAQYKPELLEILHNKPLNELSPIEKVLFSEEDWRLQNLALQELADYELRLDLLAKGATWEHNENVRLSDELAAQSAQLDALKEVLRRYMIFEKSLDGYLELSREFGACEHPESSVWMTEWLERVLREPAKAALAHGEPEESRTK